MLWDNRWAEYGISDQAAEVIIEAVMLYEARQATAELNQTDQA